MKKTSLILRAPNWIGDAVYCLPVWERLSEQHELHIVGRGWLGDLLSGYHDWHTYKLPMGTWKRRALYRQIRQKLKSPLAKNMNAIAFPTSFGSVFEMKLAGLNVIGHAHEGRTIFLKRSLPMPPAYSSIYQRYWELGDLLLHKKLPAPNRIDFRVDPKIEAETLQLLAEQGLQPKGYVAVCPFAAGDFDGVDKKWPAFAAFADKMKAKGYQLVCCPAPNEEGDWQEKYSNNPALKGLNLSQYAAVLKNAICVVSNDTGPGHLAAAVGVPMISVLNRTVREMYGAIGPNVTAVQAEGWPDVETVLNHTLERIQSASK